MNKIIRTPLVCLLVIFWLSSCATQQPEVKPVAVKSHPFTSTATYTGTIPCDDCERVDITLNIRPDSLYQLRKTHISEDAEVRVESQIGKWDYLVEDKLLILGKQRGMLKTYAVEDSNSLKFVEWQGTDNKSQIQYSLTKSNEVDPFTDIVKISGLFGSEESNPQMKICSADVLLPVSRTRDYPTLFQNFLNTPHEKGTPLLISVLGRISTKDGSDEEIIIEQFRKTYPDRGCSGDKIKQSLVGTFWHLIEIDGKSVSRPADGSSPYLLLDPNKSFEAFVSCNKIRGDFLVKGDTFLINRSPDIRMACPGGLNLENTFIKTLESTESYRVDGDYLELLDKNEQVSARFQAGS